MSYFNGILNFIGELISSDGNKYFQRGDYNRAITQYSRAIFFYKRNNISKCLTNRCSCYMLLKNYKAAIEDSIRAIRNDKCEKAYEQLIGSFLHLGDYIAAEMVMLEMEKTYPDNEIIPKSRQDCFSVFILVGDSNICHSIKNYTEAISKISSALQIFTACESILALKDKYVSAKLIQTETSSIAFKYAYEHYEDGRWDHCIENLHEVLFIDPYHSEALELLTKIEKHYKPLKSVFKEKGNERKANHNINGLRTLMDEAQRHYDAGEYELCLHRCDQIIKTTICVEAAGLKIEALTQLCNQNIIDAKHNLSTEMYKECMQDCNNVLTRTEPFLSFGAYRKHAHSMLSEVRKHIETTMIQANHNFQKRLFVECIKNCEHILSIEDSIEAVALLNNSQSSLKRDALRQLCKQNIIEAEHNFSTQMYKECMQNCNNVLISTKPFIGFETEEAEANSILREVRKHIETTMIQANHNFQKRLFDECIKNCEHILSIEDSIEAVALLNKSKSLKIEDSLAVAKCKFDSEEFDECIKECQAILIRFKCSKARNLSEMAKSQKKTQTEITDRIFQVKKYYETKMFKECIEECHYILEIKEISEIRLILIEVREFLDKTLAQAIRRFELEYYDQCIEACELILSIEDSCEASNLLKLSKEEECMKKQIKVGLANARDLYNRKFYKACIEKCKEILKTRETCEATHLIDLCVTNQLAAQSKITNRLLNNANKFYEIKDFKKCLANCYKALKITELQEARDIIQKVKIEKKNRKQINDGMIRAKQHYANNKFKNCITECEKVLKIEQRMEAITLMESAKIELQNGLKNRILNAEQHFSRAEYKECVDNCTVILKQQEIVHVKEMRKRCEIELAYEKLTDPYDILQVAKNSDQTTIRSSYHLLSFRYHPDKHSKATHEMRIYNEGLYKKITNAYRNLSKQS